MKVKNPTAVPTKQQTKATIQAKGIVWGWR